MQIENFFHCIKNTEFIWDNSIWGDLFFNLTIDDTYKSCTTIEHSMSTFDSIESSGFKAQIEFITPEFQQRYLFNKLSFLSEKDWSSDRYFKLTLLSSVELILKNKNLSFIAKKLVKSIHPLIAEDGYDISYSEENLPFSIFISIPKYYEKNCELRLAEGFLHECMHLYLSVINEKFPFISKEEATFFSPWKNENRPVYGVLHGIFVFSAIYQWLDLYEKDNPYSILRRNQIKYEFSKLLDFTKFDYLTPLGKVFSEKCVDCVMNYPVEN